ncbi:MAG: hypothetical protein ABI947_15415 [Chloroflexota bacterium]
MQREYHVSAKIEGDNIMVRGQLSRRTDLPTTQLTFTDMRSTVSYPVTIYWKSQPPNDHAQLAAVERAVLNYCTQLFHEAAYAGPIDCCL